MSSTLSSGTSTRSSGRSNQTPACDIISEENTGSRPAASIYGRRHLRSAASGKEFSYQEMFQAYCGCQVDLDGAGFAKICRDALLIDQVGFTVAEADILFAKIVNKGQRRMSLHQFEEALWTFAEEHNTDYGDVLEAVAGIGSFEKVGAPTYRRGASSSLSNSTSLSSQSSYAEDVQLVARRSSEQAAASDLPPLGRFASDAPMPRLLGSTVGACNKVHKIPVEGGANVLPFCP